MVRMVTRLARGTVTDMDAQLGEERVTLLAPVGGQLGPDRVAGGGHEGLRRWEWRQTLVHHGLLLVVMHKG